jgi:hypothetical protein
MGENLNSYWGVVKKLGVLFSISGTARLQLRPNRKPDDADPPNTQLLMQLEYFGTFSSRRLD